MNIASLYAKFCDERRCKTCGGAPLEFFENAGKEYYCCPVCGERGNAYDLCVKQFGMNHGNAMLCVEAAESLSDTVKMKTLSTGVSSLGHFISRVGAEQLVEIVSFIKLCGVDFILEKANEEIERRYPKDCFKKEDEQRGEESEQV